MDTLKKLRDWALQHTGTPLGLGAILLLVIVVLYSVLVTPTAAQDQANGIKGGLQFFGTRPVMTGFLLFLLSVAVFLFTGWLAQKHAEKVAAKQKAETVAATTAISAASERAAAQHSDAVADRVSVELSATRAELGRLRADLEEVSQSARATANRAALFEKYNALFIQWRTLMENWKALTEFVDASVDPIIPFGAQRYMHPLNATLYLARNVRTTLLALCADEIPGRLPDADQAADVEDVAQLDKFGDADSRKKWRILALLIPALESATPRVLEALMKREQQISSGRPQN